jgi:hypothetical protein
VSHNKKPFNISTTIGLDAKVNKSKPKGELTLSHLRKSFPKKRKQKKARCYPRSCSSVVKYFFTTCMIENVGDALGAVACSLAYQAIDIALTDGVV